MKLAPRTTFAVLMAGTLLALPAAAQQRTLVINTDTTDPAPKAAFEQLIADFEAANPDVKVTQNIFDHEGYKTSIRNFLTADPPDLANWYAGNRMAPFVEAGLFEDISDLWASENMGETLKAAEASMTIDGKQWGVPYTYYQWGIYYNKTLFEEHGVDVPTTWDEFLAACAVFKEAGIDCTTTGTKALWPTGGWFDYMNLRTNGYEFHMDLTAGKIPWTDERVKNTFAEWAKLIEPGYVTADHVAIDWQDALPLLAQGKAATYLIGNFAVAPLKDAGMTDDTLGFFAFPEISPDIPRAEDAPTDTIHIPSGAKNKEDARLFLAFLAKADVQTQINNTLAQLPVNNQSEVGTDPFLQQGFELLSESYALAQFFDRDASPEMAKAGMEGFQQFMVQPQNLDQILDRLEKIRQRLYE